MPAAARGGNLDALLNVLDPNIVLRSDLADSPSVVRGATNVAKGALANARLARFADLALVNDNVGLVVAARGRLSRALRFRIRGERIVEMEIITEPKHLGELEIKVCGRGD